MSHRIPEIDFIRGIAILAMVVFHIVVDLKDFYGYPLDYLSGFWYYEGKASACLFMFIAGVSATFHRHNIRHGLFILFWGMLLSAVTYVYNPNIYIRFGILHLLGSCMLLYPLLAHLPARWLLLPAVTFWAAGNWTETITPATALLLPLGMRPSDFVSMDYYPLLPWSGVFFLGAAAGKWLYPSKRPLFPALSLPRSIIRLGRHSLAIYLLHQPVLLALLWLYHHLPL